MPKKFSHSNPPEADEFRRRAVKMFDDGEIHNESFETPNDNNSNLRDTAEDLLDVSETGDSFGRIKKESRQRSVRDYALYLVSVNTYTERKLRDKLKSKKIGGTPCYTETEIDGAVEYLKGFGYINDLRLAQNSLPSLADRNWGRVKICFYLRKNGISDEIIEELDFSEIDFVAHCRALLKKYRSQPRQKQFRALYNAGFSVDEIREVLGDDADIEE